MGPPTWTGVNWMEDIIPVTETHRARSWATVAFPGGQVDGWASLGSKVDYRGDIVTLSWQHLHNHNRGAVLSMVLMARYDGTHLVLANEF